VKIVEPRPGEMWWSISMVASHDGGRVLQGWVEKLESTFMSRGGLSRDHSLVLDVGGKSDQAFNENWNVRKKVPEERGER